MWGIARDKKRDKDAQSVKKGNTWYFGYKAHIGVDSQTGLVYTVKSTEANVHDVTVIQELLTGEENLVYGDSGYIGAEKRENAVVKNKCGKKIKYKINRRPSQMNFVIMRCFLKSIHPFEDGNGCVVRLLVSLYLYKAKVINFLFFYISESTSEDKSVYYTYQTVG